MPYLVDGHNLVPRVGGMSLRALDDEEKLIELLQTFGRLKRAIVEVYFDRAPAGFSGSRSYGQVRVHFVHEGGSADEAIRARLQRLKDCANWTVVSSDVQVQVEARARHARVMPSEEFARLLNQTLQEGGSLSGRERSLSKEEVNEWLDLFRKSSNGKHKSTDAK